MGFQIAELRKLTKVAFGCSCSKSEVGHDIFRCDFFFVGHKLQNIDQFLCQGWLYRPLSFRIIDCRAVIGIHQSYRVGYQRIRHRLVEVYLFRDAQLFMLLEYAYTMPKDTQGGPKEDLRDTKGGSP